MPSKRWRRERKLFDFILSRKAYAHTAENDLTRPAVSLLSCFFTAENGLKMVLRLFSLGGLLVIGSCFFSFSFTGLLEGGMKVMES